MFKENILSSKTWVALEAKKVLQRAKKDNKKQIILTFSVLKFTKNKY